MRFIPQRIASRLDAVCAAYRILRHYTNRNIDFTEKLFACVAVIETFPFLVIKSSPYYDREIRGVT
jgi:hypothetical protein